VYLFWSTKQNNIWQMFKVLNIFYLIRCLVVNKLFRYFEQFVHRIKKLFYDSVTNKNLGYVWINRIWWSKMEWSDIKLDFIVWIFFFKWMEWYGIRCSSYFISYHVFFLFSFYPIQCFLFIFISSNLKGIQWNETYKLNHYYFTFFLLRFIISSTPMF
jgi:hypothetical protein